MVDRMRGADGIILSPVRLRQAYPAEFDLMARIAGLRLRDRWGGWNDEPYRLQAGGKSAPTSG